MSCHDSKFFIIEAIRIADNSTSVPPPQCIKAAEMPFLGLAFLSDNLIIAAGFDAEPIMLFKQQGHSWSVFTIQAGDVSSFKPSECPIPASLKDLTAQSQLITGGQHIIWIVSLPSLQSARPLRGSPSVNDSYPRISLPGWHSSARHRRRR